MLPMKHATASSSRPNRRSQSHVLPSHGAHAPNSRGARAPSRAVVGAPANHNQPSSNPYHPTKPNNPLHSVSSFPNQPQTRNTRHYGAVPPCPASSRLVPDKFHIFFGAAPAAFRQPSSHPKNNFLPNEPIFIHARLSFLKNTPVKRTHSNPFSPPFPTY